MLKYIWIPIQKLCQEINEEQCFIQVQHFSSFPSVYLQFLLCLDLAEYRSYFVCTHYVKESINTHWNREFLFLVIDTCFDLIRTLLVTMFLFSLTD